MPAREANPWGANPSLGRMGGWRATHDLPPPPLTGRTGTFLERTCPPAGQSDAPETARRHKIMIAVALSSCPVRRAWTIRAG